MRELMLGGTVSAVALLALGVAAKHGRKMYEEHCGASMASGCQGSC